MKQTAVEFLKERYYDCPKYEAVLTESDFEQAKEMEKQQIIDAVLYGFRIDAESFDWKGDNFNSEQYYNETFNK